MSISLPADTLFLWWLGEPARPALIGELQTARALRGVSLRYAAGWLTHGFALSEDLPLTPGEFLPCARDTAAGAVDDARPDRWGERVIRVLDRPPRLSLMEYLLLAGDERFGALGVSASADSYQPRMHGPLPRLNDVDQISGLVQAIAIGDSVPEGQRRLIAPGASMGGARPKALLDIDGEGWLVKFNEHGESIDWPLVEHASMTLAAAADITVAATRVIPLRTGTARRAQHAVAIRRFDREGSRRIHALSANVALRAAGEAMGYPELAQLLRRRGALGGGLGRRQMRELFRRMVFNILIDNTDDHEKNHVVLMNDRAEYLLSPAFDVLPSGHALRYQQMRVGDQAHDATIDNALSQHRLFGLSLADAHADVRRVADALTGWKAHFSLAGVRDDDIDVLASQIDGAFLADQRRAWARPDA